MDDSATIRSYRDDGVLHAHAHVQVVLPISGALEIEVAGKGAQLNAGLSAFIAPGEKHTQAGLSENCSLVLDVDRAGFSDRVLDDLGTRRFFLMPPAVRHLVEFTALQPVDAVTDAAMSTALAKLLVNGLEGLRQTPDRLRALWEAVQRDPAADWDVTRLARHLAVSRTKLYRELAEEDGATPGRFIAKARVEAAQRAIETGTKSLADVAISSGFSDQAALTRAMRREAGCTPGEWRRRAIGTIRQ